MSIINEKQGAATYQASAPIMEDGYSYTPNIPVLTKIDNIKAEHFLKFFAEGEALTFQTFDDTKNNNRQLARIFHGSLEEHLPALIELNEQGAGVFFVVNATDLKGRKTENIVRVRALYVDLDGTPLEPILSAPLLPHIIIETSPKRYHVYWLIEGLELELFSLVQKVLIKQFNGDPSVHDLPRVMRLPGFYHRKGQPFMVHVINNDGGVPYVVSQFLQAFKIDLGMKQQVEIDVQDQILQELKNNKLILQPSSSRSGAWEILCPFRESHTTGDGGTVYFEPNSNGYEKAAFKCHHAHCVHRDIEDLRLYLNINDEWDDPIALREELKPVMPFKKEILPDVLRPWIMDVAERMQVPVDFLAATCVVVLGSLIGRKIGVYPKAYDDWLVIPNIWGAIVGRPSLLKSPAIEEMMKPLDELAAEAIFKHKEDEVAYQQDEMWLEAQKTAQKEAMRKAAKKPSVQKPKFDQISTVNKPLLKRYKTEDGTVEKIGEILLENPQGILVHRDELVGWLKSLDKYGREGDRAFFLESWNGKGSYTVDRISRGTLHIPALCLSIIGGIQPGPLSSYVQQAASGGGGDDGLLQRFQLLVWPDAPKTWENVDRKPNIEAREEVVKVFKNIDTFEPFEPTSGEVLKTQPLRFSEEAQILFNEWRTFLERRLCSGELTPSLESHLGKYRSLMPKLALIFYVVETIGRGGRAIAIDVPAVDKAIEWCSYLETHAQRLFSSSKNLSMESARALLDRIKKGDLANGFSLRDVYHAKHWSKLETAEQVTEAVKTLEEFGYVKTEIVKTLGRSSTKVIIHPKVRKKQPLS